MKILFVVPSLDGGGAERHIVILANQLREMGLELGVVTFRPDGPLARVLSRGIPVFRLASERVNRGAAWALSGKILRRSVGGYLTRVLLYYAGGATRQLRSIAHGYKANVIVSCLWESDLFARIALGCRRDDRPMRWTSVIEYNLAANVREKLLGGVRILIPRLVYRTIDAFVAPSRVVESQIGSLISGHAIPIEVIPNALAYEMIRGLAERADNPRPDSRTRIVVAVGRFVWEKGFDLLVRSFRSVSEGIPEARLEIVGDGPLRAELESLVNSLGLATRVSFTGFLENPYAVMKRADVVVVPSRWETFGNVIGEAMILGKPVVAAACGGSEDLIESRYDGVIVGQDDVPGLSSRLWTC